MSLDIFQKVVVETFSGLRPLAPDLKAFPDENVLVEFGFVFVRKSSKDNRLIPIHSAGRATFCMTADAREIGYVGRGDIPPMLAGASRERNRHFSDVRKIESR